MQRSTASALRPALRSVALRQGKSVVRRPARSYATATDSAPAASGSHLVSGLAGGGIVLLGIYGYYHYSGAKSAVDTVRSASQTATQLKEKAKQSVPSSSAMLGMVRSAAHSYAAAFPGAAYLVDSTFDQIEKIAEKNGPEVEKLVKEVYDDISKAVQQGGDNVTDNVMAAIQKTVVKIQKLSSELSSNALKPYLDKNPQLRDAVYESIEQLNSFGDKYGPEARKLAEDTVKQIKDIADQGINVTSIAKASALAKSKLAEIQKLGAKAGSDAYSKAAESARPILDKAPDVKKYLEDKIGDLKEYVGDDGVKLINDTYAEVEAAGKKGDTKKLMEIAKKRIAELQNLAKEKGGDIASKAAEKAKDLPGADKVLAAVPGADKLFESMPNLKDLAHLRSLAQEKGGDFEKLLEESYEEIKGVLEKRAKQAKDLGSEAATDAKKQVSK